MLGKKIRELRKEKGIKQKELAMALGVTIQAVSLWETDNTDPDILNIKRIAQFFNISIDELMDFDSFDYTFEYQHNNTKLIHKERKNTNSDN